MMFWFLVALAVLAVVAAAKFASGSAPAKVPSKKTSSSSSSSSSSSGTRRKDASAAAAGAGADFTSATGTSSATSTAKGQTFVREPISTHMALEDLPGIGDTLAKKMRAKGAHTTLDIIAYRMQYEDDDEFLSQLDIKFPNDTLKLEFVTAISEKAAAIGAY